MTSNANFAESVKSALQFLGQYGFEAISSEATIVRFASTTAFLNVYIGRSSRELGLEFGQIGNGKDERGYSMSELIRAKSPDRAATYRKWTVTSPSELSRALDALAEHLRQFGTDFLQGNREAFAQLAKARQEWANSYAADVKYRQTIPLANDAFRRGDFQAAARLYEGVRDNLGPAELKKLEFAKKHGP